MQTIIKKVILPEGKRIIAISDIHGHYSYLKNLLEKIHFCENDILFVVGDIIEKGPESLKTVRYIMDLCKHFTVYVLNGNVDAWRMQLLDEDTKDSNNWFFHSVMYMKNNWGSSFFIEMCDEMNIDFSNDELPLIKKQLRDHFIKELNFLRSLPTIIETQKFIFVHAGIPNENVDSLVETDAFEFLRINAFAESDLYFNKYVVVGHLPVTNYNKKISVSNPIVNRKKKIVSIDGGCGLRHDGQLNAFIIPDINSEEFSYAFYDDFRSVIALDSQEVSESSINISYTDNKINVLEHGEEFSYIEHLSTKYQLWVHNDFILNDGISINDYSDYILPVKPGDVLSLLKETSKGYLVKKDGISGWYYGKIKSL